MFWFIIILSVFVLAVIGSFVLTSQIMNFAVSKQLFDIEDERHTHHHLVPRLGGVVFFPVVVVAFILTTAITQTLGFDQMFLDTGAEAMPLAYASCAIFLLYIVGLVDDLKGVRYQSKFLAQFICALLLVAGGVVMSDLQGLFFITSLPQWIAVPLTVVLIVFVVNAINLIDGIDGLASGLCILAFLCYGIVFYNAGVHIQSMLSFASVGVILPFFYYNVFGDADQGRKIFMGDIGSTTLGLMLCFQGLQIAQLHEIQPLSAHPLALAFSPLLIPCFDVIRVFFLRLSRGRNPFLADKNHIHHNLMALGWSQKKTMAVIVASSFSLILCNILLSLLLNVTLLFCLDVLVWVVANLAIARKMRTC